MIDIQDIKNSFPKRTADSNKGDYGHLLVVAGSLGYTGAAYMTAQAAIRTGAGLVTLLVPQRVYDILASKLTEVMVSPAPDTREGSFSFKAAKKIDSFLEKCNSLVVGPGLSRNKDTERLVEYLVKTVRVPTVLDADGINALEGKADLLKKASAPIILTPHPGELSRLTGIEVAIIQKNRKDIALKVACEYNIVLVLKGHHTVVASPEGKVYINDTGNSGMASGGTGDVLTGVIGAFLAQGQSPFNAACLGAYFHGLAGDHAVREKGVLGLIATDLLDKLPEALKTLG